MMRELPGLVIVLAITLAPAAAWPADEPPPTDSAAEETGRESPQKPDDGASESILERERRLLRERLYGATPEERERLSEERRRLAALAKSFGTDPTAIIGYVQSLYQYNAYTNGLNLQGPIAVVQVPVTPNFFVRATMPYVWADPNNPRGSTGNGTSDLVVRAAGRLYASENVALLVGTDLSFPTASETPLGTGKYTLGPGFALGAPLPRIRTMFYTVVQDYHSIGGDPSRANVHYMQVQPTFNTIWSKHWWTSFVADWDINWEKNRKTDLNLTGQIGYNIDGHWNVFAGGGAGVVGRNTSSLAYDWTANVGIRWVFRTPLFGKTVFDLPIEPEKAR